MINFKENDVVKVRVGGRSRQARVIDICADSAMVEFKNKRIFVCHVSELKPILEGCVSKAQERRIKAQLGL